MRDPLVGIPEIERDIGFVEVVVREVLLDGIPLVAEADDEIVEPIMGVDLHDVPQDWLFSNLDHRLRLQVRFLADSRPESARKNDDFHRISPLHFLLPMEMKFRCRKRSRYFSGFFLHDFFGGFSFCSSGPL
jgi:hypothetical protein